MKKAAPITETPITATIDANQLLAALIAFKKGDFSVRLPVDQVGLAGKIVDTLNDIFELNENMCGELGRVSTAVGKEGKIGQRASLPSGAGSWASCVESVNSLISDLVQPSTEIARIIGAVAQGDLSQKMSLEAEGRPLKGEFVRTARVVNTMVDQLNSFSSEVTRVAREVGTEGKLGGQAVVTGVAGTWKDLTDSVNSMASNLTNQVRNIAEVTTAVARGDLSRKITVNVQGEILELKNTINTMVDQLSSFASEVTRVAREVGTEGNLGGQAEVRGVAGTWKDLTDSVNLMAGNLTAQVRNIAQVTTAVAKGDLSRKITVDVRGEILELKNTINTMVDQLSSFASEVTRVAREVGTEGKLGGQADVRGVAGTWKDLTDSVNSMASNLTNQVRNIAQVTTAVANGDLSSKITVDVRGEILELKNTINTMVDQLGSFASEVTRVAREVGTEGKLGGQASVPGAAGTWRNLTDNVNQLAANLTTQVRAIAEVATAVTKGDLTRSIAVQAEGEVAALKDNINQMIGNLAETTRKNTDQDWLKTNIAKFTRMLQGQRDLLTVAQLLLSELTPLVGAQRGTFYIADSANGESRLKFMAGYAYDERDNIPAEFKFGQGLVGQCAQEKQRIIVRDVPREYIRIGSSLGSATPATVVVLPVLFEREVKAVVELASFQQLSSVHLAFLDQLTESMGIVLNTIAATMRTEQLLQQSQALAEELQKTNAQIQEKAQLLADQNTEVEAKNREIEQAKQALEEKAEQLALTSKYKSEFLANMSHELRTPLNNLLILARVLADNTEGNLNQKQVKFAATIHSSGTDLLALISDILDLSKIESGKMDVEVGNIRFTELQDYCARTFRHVADGKGLEFGIDVDPQLASDAIRSDAKRLQQVLKNLLSNALKFTEHGSVRLKIERAESGWTPTHPVLNRARNVVAFSVIDTGIGIAREKQHIVFEAFQQADGTTSRKYGGTGLGLSISRELARLLGGEIRLQSATGRGSTFTLYLPQSYVSLAPRLETLETGAVRKPVESRFPTEVGLVLPSSNSVPEEDLVDDDRNLIAPGDRALLLADDDLNFARMMVEAAHDRGFKALVALRGSSALSLAREFQPGAIVLGTRLPDMNGWTLLDRLKHDPAVSHIPVHAACTHEQSRSALALGAATCIGRNDNRDALEQAFSAIHRSMRQPRKLLLIAGQEARRSEIRSLMAGQDLRILEAPDITAALDAIERDDIDGIVIDWVSPGTAVFDFVAAVNASGALLQPPVIITAATELPEDQISEIQARAAAGAVRFAPTPQRLLDETVRALHLREISLSDSQKHVIAEARVPDTLLAGRTVLIIDDDLRNIFALTSVLEQHGLKVLHAENGRAGIEILRHAKNVDAVLLDVMMPGMDGYETARAIRQIPEFQALPIVALTAKAMKGDREKCLQAGASDYVTKPVDLEHLFSVMRVCMMRDTRADFGDASGTVSKYSVEHDSSIEDDRHDIRAGDQLLLIVEDDVIFARVMLDAAHRHGLKGLVALRGAAAIRLAREFRPSAISLDVRLPDMSGWTVLDLLKHNPETRHIPIHVISGHENNRQGFVLGALSCVQKTSAAESLDKVFGVIRRSVEPRTRKLLLVSDSQPLRHEIESAIGAGDVEFIDASSAAGALDVISAQYVDGIVIDWVMSERLDAEFIEEMQRRLAPFVPPCIVFGTRKLTRAQAAELRRLSHASLVRYAPSIERLLDETVLLLHRSPDALSEQQREILAAVRQVDPVLSGRKILVIDDDLRNIFALTSVLEQRDLTVLHAETGEAGIEVLRKNPEIDAVLLDVVMPGLDGCETAAAIRRMPGFESLPIIAVTGKAAKSDREKCLAAGASDYIAKPVDLEQLFSVIRVWLARMQEPVQVPAAEMSDSR